MAHSNMKFIAQILLLGMVLNFLSACGYLLTPYWAANNNMEEKIIKSHPIGSDSKALEEKLTNLGFKRQADNNKMRYRAVAYSCVGTVIWINDETGRIKEYLVKEPFCEGFL